MGTIVAGMATSHAFAFLEPSEWDGFRTRNRESLRKRTGQEPPQHPRVGMETLADNERRYHRVRAAHQALRAQIESARPDAFVVIGDDQSENFVANIPQLAVYVGNSIRYPVHQGIASAIVEATVAEGFDVASVSALEGGELKSHAHLQVLEGLARDLDIPVVLVFVNAIHYPAIEPRRCYAFGQALRRAIARRPGEERVALCASGGLSHFTAGYPWKRYQGPFGYGDISEDFDRRAIEWMEHGEGERLAELSGAELLAHGDIEMRSWIALLGALGPVPASFTVYEPFFRAVMGMAVASWPGE